MINTAQDSVNECKKALKSVVTFRGNLCKNIRWDLVTHSAPHSQQNSYNGASVTQIKLICVVQKQHKHKDVTLDGIYELLEGRRKTAL